MKCVLCRQGETSRGNPTVTLQRDDTTMVIKQVPADICDNCGEYYLSDSVTEQGLQMAEDAVLRGAEVEILRFTAEPAVFVTPE